MRPFCDLQAAEILRWRRTDDVGLAGKQIGNASGVLGHDLDHQTLPVRHVLVPVVRIPLETDIFVGAPLLEHSWPRADPGRMQLEMFVAQFFARFVGPDSHVLGQEIHPRRIRLLQVHVHAARASRPRPCRCGRTDRAAPRSASSPASNSKLYLTSADVIFWPSWK